MFRAARRSLQHSRHRLDRVVPENPRSPQAGPGVAVAVIAVGVVAVAVVAVAVGSRSKAPPPTSDSSGAYGFILEREVIVLADPWTPSARLALTRGVSHALRRPPDFPSLSSRMPGASP